MPCIRSFVRACVCGVCTRPQSAHINKWLLFITWNLTVNAFCFGFFSLLAVLYAPSRFLFVCCVHWMRLNFTEAWNFKITSTYPCTHTHTHMHTNTCGSISRYGWKCIVCSKCTLRTHAALNEAINLFCCVMVDGNNQVYDKEYVCTIHVSYGMPMYKPHPVSNRLKENNDMSF